MKAFFKKVSDVLKTVFGWGIMICLFAGGLTFFGYVAALIIGGETATAICVFIYKTITPVIVYASTILVLLGLVAMYFAGEMALTSDKKKKGKKKIQGVSDEGDAVEDVEAAMAAEAVDAAETTETAEAVEAAETDTAAEEE